MLRLLFIALLFVVPTLACEAKIRNRVQFVVVIPSYNNEKWVAQNLESVVNQTYRNFTVYYINDCSKDNTGALVDQFVKSWGLEGKFTVVHNGERKGALANLYQAIHSTDPRKVVVTIDGDDVLAHRDVLARLAEVYADKNVWMTYGNFQTEPREWGSCCARIPQSVSDKNSYRSYKWVASHLRTFYARLFHLIQKKDLQLKGEFFPMTWDMAFMFPMLEMCTKNHFRYIPEILYIYNVMNPINDNRVNAQLQRDLDKHIRAMPPYQPIQSLF